MAGKTPLIIGLTGSIGSGKSEAAKLFKELGAEIIDADLLAREAVKPGTEGLNEIRSTFGEGFLLPDGTLNRKLLGSVVFADQKKREQLESILHPKIRELFKKALSAAKHRPAELIVYVVPLLFEAKHDFPDIKKRVAVLALKERCLERIVKRDSLSPVEAEARFAAQLPPEQKASRADLVIWNNGSLDELRTAVGQAYRQLTER